ncbi:MAG: hypothetical protein KAQ79_15055 [Cyclobacteriaceae bacterium]|nr:hypothetical protein [Cyclobacteriaceae bacterium]MCK5277628.1 hypothetical protein [Cyclobacteriaceae bacterium]
MEAGIAFGKPMAIEGRPKSEECHNWQQTTIRHLNNIAFPDFFLVKVVTYEPMYFQDKPENKPLHGKQNSGYLIP